VLMNTNPTHSCVNEYPHD